MKFMEICSFVAIIAGSVMFGLLSRPAEMGLVIGAGAIALFFLNIDKFSSFKGAGIEANLRERIEAVIEKETEPYLESVNSEMGEIGNSVPDISRINENTKKVINSLRHHEYTWRYLGGIRRDTKLADVQIKESLNWLITNGYARQSLGKHGTIWNLTEQGRYLHIVIAFENVNT